jgi:hypothetical protein
LLHDHRTFGVSAGEPRQDVDPWRQIADWRRAISYLESRPEVDASRIGLWGTSYAGAGRNILAALDGNFGDTPIDSRCDVEPRCVRLPPGPEAAGPAADKRSTGRRRRQPPKRRRSTERDSTPVPAPWALASAAQRRRAIVCQPLTLLPSHAPIGFSGNPLPLIARTLASCCC